MTMRWGGGGGEIEENKLMFLGVGEGGWIQKMVRRGRIFLMTQGGLNLKGGVG